MVTLDQLPLSDLVKAIVERMSPSAVDALLRGFESLRECGIKFSTEDAHGSFDYLTCLSLPQIWSAGLMPMPSDTSAIEQFIAFHYNVTNRIVAAGSKLTSNGTACADEDSLIIHMFAREMLDSVLLMQIQLSEDCEF
jgi:hypothetical protein